MDESGIKTPWFGQVSGDLNPKFQVGTLNPKTFEFGEFRRVNALVSNPNIFSPAIFCLR